jgi:integrase
MVIFIDQSKNEKDRYVMLSPKLLGILRSYWKATRPKDWLFPGALPDRPITRFAVEAACQEAHRISGLSKPVTPHLLRHAFAAGFPRWGPPDFLSSGPPDWGRRRSR